ncbi:CUB and zona pellucida-like domain-containing protein 1 [Fundulus heteroclitus]|uniref:CUB and zona pellucida-like domain-containing protein 1 n=1 Tax=Fundulus heteroclitus TaxID=8078 RepID=UPI00165CD8FF|nr:CUB and zona pellucida-like domain-containing protein 1 [Fundulus heteroclitus]
MVVEDYPRNTIDLSYSDGSRSRKSPLLSRGKRQVNSPTPPTNTISPPTWWGLWQTSTTTVAPTTPLWWTQPPRPSTAENNSSGRPTVTPQTRSGSPLSKLPLQFAFLVDPAAPSCQEGLYLPKLLAPTPADGERIMAEVNKEVEIRVKAQATHSTIQSLVISGPANITKHRDTNGEFVIRWTPILDDLGEQYPICFAVESLRGSSGYQSEMRCVLVEIRKEQIEATVTCTETTMKVEVEKDSFFGLEEEHLRLSDPSNTICSLDKLSNNTHIVAIIPLNGCGTEIEEDDDYLIFKNEITTVEDDPNELITRKHLVEARFYCQYPKRGNVTLSFSAHRKNVTVWEKGFGKFTYQFQFYQDDQFEAMFDPNLYPLEFDIGNRIYMQIDASTSINNTEMFVESCRAAPYDNPNYHPTYSIIENGCVVDSTVQTYPASNDRQFQFSMEAFKFIGLHDQVYISCTVMMCEAGNPNTRCSRGCMNSTWSNGHNRRKREAMIQSGKHFVSQGPLRLKREADLRGGSAFNLNLVFVAGCLLVAVGMVCGVLIYKTKASRVKYQPLSSYEN